MNEVLRAALEPVILALLDARPDHGYNLIRRIREEMGADLSDGSLYPALARLETAGKIAGTWMPGQNGRERKVYSLTNKGRQILQRARAGWSAFSGSLTSLLGGARG